MLRYWCFERDPIEIKFSSVKHIIYYKSGIPKCFPTWNKPGRSQSPMPVLSRDREENVPECSGWEISKNFSGKIRFLGNGIWECSPLLMFKFYNKISSIILLRNTFRCKASTMFYWNNPRFSVIANYGEDQKRTSLSVISDNKRIEIETKPSEDGESIKVWCGNFFSR